MKKTLTLLLAALMLLSALPALTEALPPDLELPERPGRLEAELNPLGEGTRSATPQTEDVVEISDGVFRITSKGITVSLSAPFGWHAFSQDVKQQLDDYLYVFNDPRGAMEFVIGHDLSLFALDAQSGDQLLFYTRDSATTRFFNDLQNPEVQALALGYFQKNAPEGHDASAITVKDRAFIRSLELTGAGEQILVIFTYTQGIQVGFQLQPVDGQIGPEDEALLLSFVEGAVIHEPAQ